MRIINHADADNWSSSCHCQCESLKVFHYLNIVMIMINIIT